MLRSKPFKIIHMRHHNMSPKSLHTHYSTSIDLLPKQYAEAFQNSRDLRSALESLDAQFAPLSSVHSDLVQQLLNFPPLNFPTETQRIARANQIITILEDMRRFFSDDASNDLNRQQCLVILSNMSEYIKKTFGPSIEIHPSDISPVHTGWVTGLITTRIS